MDNYRSRLRKEQLSIGQENKCKQARIVRSLV
jgi:hypothetical protein